MPNNWSDPSDYLQGALGVPVTITSGMRTPQHNALVGGVPNSDHLRGQAYDFVPKGMSMADAAARLQQSGIPTTKIINENDHIHVSYPKGQMAQPGISDADLLSALTGGNPSGSASPSQGEVAKSQISDADLLKALTSSPVSSQPSGQEFPAGDSRNTPAAVTVGQPPKANPIADAIHAIPGGLVKGAAAVAGLPGDLNSLLDKGANMLTGAHISTNHFPTSEGIGNAVSSPFGGFYKPQTSAGKYADTISQFAPAALAPGNMLLKAARVAAPGVASEAAGQATEGTSMEGPARLVGALAGAGGVGGIRHAIENPKEFLPSSSDIRQAASGAYKRAEQAGVVMKGSSVKQLGQDINQAVTDAGIDPTLHPKAVAALGRITNSKGAINLKQMDILRRVANGAAGSMDKDESRIAHIIVDHIDNYVENLGPSDILAGNAQDASEALKEARSLWAKQAKSSSIDSLIDRAKNRAETVGGSGLENALRVEFRGLAQNDKRLSRFSPVERDAIRAVARGGPMSNFARTVGKLAPTNLISILGEMGAIAHDPKALAIPVAGTLGRALATNMTKRNALAASETVRRGAPKVTKQVITKELLSTLLERNRDNGNNNLVPSMATP